MARDQPNLLFICIDTMRSDFALGEFGREKPFIDFLKDAGVAFDTVISSASSTTPCVAGYMTGQYPPEHGILSLREFELNDDVETLAEQFSAAGYETTASVCGPLISDTGLDSGFDSYEYRDSEATVYTEWFETCKSQLRNTAEPWFTYLHLWEPHIHRDLPPEVGDDEIEYDASIRGVTEKLEELRSIVDLEDTIIAVTGDHGESFYDGTVRNKAAVIGLNKVPIPCTDMRTRDLRSVVYDNLLRPNEIDLEWLYNGARRFSTQPFPNAFHREGHGYQVYDFLTRVPLVLAGPGIPDADTVSSQIRQIDIFPTLLSAAGLSTPAGVSGEDVLTGQVSDHPAHVRAVGAFKDSDRWLDGVRTENWKFIKGRSRPVRQLFDLSEDPHELRNVIEEYPTKAAELERRVDEFVNREQTTTPKGADGQAEQRMTERLEDLGYL